MQHNFINNSLNHIGKNNPKFRLSLDKIKNTYCYKTTSQIDIKIKADGNKENTFIFDTRNFIDVM